MNCFICAGDERKKASKKSKEKEKQRREQGRKRREYEKQAKAKAEAKAKAKSEKTKSKHTTWKPTTTKDEKGDIEDAFVKSMKEGASIRDDNAPSSSSLFTSSTYSSTPFYVPNPPPKPTRR